MTNVIPFPGNRKTTSLDEARDRKVREWTMKKDKSEKTFLDFEDEVAELFQQAQRETIKAALEASDEPAGSVILDGRTCRFVLRKKQTYMTSAGEVEVERNLFRDRAEPDAQSFSALDKRVGIIEKFWTPKAAREALWMVTQMVPKKASEALKRLGGMNPSKSSLDRLPKALSEKWELDHKTYEQMLIETQDIPRGTSTLAVSLDGIYVPMEAEEETHVEKREAKHAQGLSARGPIAYREVGCGSIAFYSASAELLGAIRFGRAPEFRKFGVKAMLSSQLAPLVKGDPSLEVVYLSDGAPDHWKFFESIGIEGRQVLDFYHAAEHLHKALGAVYGEASIKTQRRSAEMRHILLEEKGGAAVVRRSLARLMGIKGLSENSQRILQQAVRYFTDHKSRMNYSELREQKIPIGSGVMEATCKTLVAQRLKLSGQRWTVDGAQAILTPRGWDQSERFDEAFALLAATYQQAITVLTPLQSNLASG